MTLTIGSLFSQSDEAMLEELARMRELAIEGTPEDADRFAHELRENSHRLLALARAGMRAPEPCVVGESYQGDSLRAVRLRDGTRVRMDRMPGGARTLVVDRPQESDGKERAK